MKRSVRVGYGLLLLLGALIWGLAFAFQSIGMENTGPFTFTGTRFILATVVVYIFSLVVDVRKKAGGHEVFSWKSATLWKAGIITGILLSIATNLQQIGIMYTDSVGKAGFITAMYIVIVPVFGIFMGKKLSPVIGLCVVISVVGLYFLTMKEEIRFSAGDLLILACAFVFAVQILVIDKFSREVDTIKFACIEFLTVSITSCIIMFILEKPDAGSLKAAIIPILYAGVLSGGAGYTIQIVCQSKLDPGVASILMSCEALFSVLGGFILLQQKLTFREMIGSALMFAAIIIVQIVPGEKKKEKD